MKSGANRNYYVKKENVSTLSLIIVEMPVKNETFFNKADKQTDIKIVPRQDLKNKNEKINVNAIYVNFLSFLLPIYNQSSFGKMFLH